MIGYEYCNGCSVNVGGMDCIHYGSPLEQYEDGDYYARPNILDPLPNVCLVVTNGQLVVLFETDMAMEVVGEIRHMATQKVLGNSCDHKMLREVYGVIMKALDAAVKQGTLAKDFRGNWHYAKEA